MDTLVYIMCYKDILYNFKNSVNPVAALQDILHIHIKSVQHEVRRARNNS